jgi:hypothetical protein
MVKYGTQEAKFPEMMKRTQKRGHQHPAKLTYKSNSSFFVLNSLGVKWLSSSL